MADLRLEVAGVERIDELRGLWLALHHHHQQVASHQPLVGDDELSWQRRRALYHDALARGGGFLVMASKASRPVGYAAVMMRKGPDDTWPVGRRYAELYSLSVAPDERGRGIGGAIFDAVERELRRRGIVDLAVAVMVGNAAAIRFYERRGLRPGEVLLYRFGADRLVTPRTGESSREGSTVTGFNRWASSAPLPLGHAGDVPWTVVGAPLNSSGGSGGEARAPGALRAAGLLEALGADDAGDIAGRVGPSERDLDSGLLGLPGLLDSSAELRDRVSELLKRRRRPLVLGGDCALLLGIGAALQRRFEQPGLWFVDGHTDTFDAALSPTGEAGDMELAALTGHGPAPLTSIADNDPVIAPERVVVLGHRHHDDHEDPRELDLIDARIARVDARAIRRLGPRAVAERAAAYLRRRADAIWLHLDLDVLDETALPAVSYPQRGGLAWPELGDLLKPLIRSHQLAGISLADLQPDLDPDGTYARRVVELLAA